MISKSNNSEENIANVVQNFDILSEFEESLDDFDKDFNASPKESFLFRGGYYFFSPDFLDQKWQFLQHIEQDDICGAK